MKTLILQTYFLAVITACRAACSIIDHGATANCSGRLLVEIPHDLPTYITALDLSYNPLWINENSFFSYQGLQLLNVSHCKLRYFYFRIITDCPNLEIVDLSDNDLLITENFGGEYLFYLHRLHTLRLAGNPIFSLPPLQSETLQYLDLQRCKIRNFNYDIPAAAYLPNLRVLNLANNPITSLSGLYSGSLLELNLSGTQLYKLELNFFSKALPKVRHLRFNDILNMNRLSASAIHLDPSLNNSIEIFEAERSYFRNLMHFRTMPLLTKVLMSQNEISSIGSRDLEENLYLLSLNLTHNRIKSIAPGAFKNTQLLEEVDLSDNQLRSVSWASELPYLLVLNITSNPLTGLEGLENANNLVVLNAGGCGLVEIPPKIFELPHLTELYLQHNDLTTLPTIRAHAIRVLDLSYNRIMHLENHWHIPYLVTLNLVGNRLTEPPPIEITRELTGTNLYLQDNPWHCSCSSREFQEFAVVAKVNDEADYRHLPQCHGPSNYSGLTWATACTMTNVAAVSPRRSTWLPILMGCISTLLVISIFLAVRARIISPTTVPVRSVVPPSTLPPEVFVPPPPPPDNSLPSYEEALLLPKPQITPTQEEASTPFPTTSRSRSPGLRRSKSNIARSPSSNSL